MAWVSENTHATVVTAETGSKQAQSYASVSVAVDGGEAIAWHGTQPGERVFARLVRAAREYVRR